MPTLKTLALLLSLTTTALAQKKAPAPAPVPPPEPAYVTFYSHSLSLTSFMPGTKNGFYSGRLYDGNTQLTHIGPGRFVTFAVKPGSHTFAANSLTSKSSDGGGVITLDLHPGQHTFVQASINVSQNIMQLAFILKEVPCTLAQASNAKSKPVATKDLFPEGEKQAVPDTAFPTCPDAPTDATPQPTTAKKTGILTKSKDFTMSLIGK